MFLWLLRLVIAFLAWRGFSRLLGGIQEGLRGPDAPAPGAQSPSVALARDPICGTYVVPSRALAVGSGSDARYFCSENCRRAYVAKRAS
jgi:YHS domain-containing protein